MNRIKERQYKHLVDKIINDARVMRMKKYVQHGKVSTYEHCMSVAKTSYAINDFFHITKKKKQLVKGAMLHDYYLYDWHKPHGNLHGFKHPKVALKNAKRDFRLTYREENIIESHMWPLTITKLPKTREAVLVCIADKICSTHETIFRR